MRGRKKENLEEAKEKPREENIKSVYFKTIKMPRLDKTVRANERFLCLLFVPIKIPPQQVDTILKKRNKDVKGVPAKR